jgi:large subunit ribosomal protein L21
MYSLETMSKFAIIQTGGKQYLVEEGTVFDIEKVESTGGKITFDNVLLTDDGSATKVGSPNVSGAKVSGEVVSEGREAKVTVIRYRPKSRHFVKRGHRQPFTKVKITEVK